MEEPRASFRRAACLPLSTSFHLAIAAHRSPWAKGAIDKVLRQTVFVLHVPNRTQDFYLGMWLPWIKATFLVEERWVVGARMFPWSLRVSALSFPPPPSGSWNMDAMAGAPAVFWSRWPQKCKPYAIEKQERQSLDPRHLELSDQPWTSNSRFLCERKTNPYFV